MPETQEQLDRQNAALTRQFLEWVAQEPRTYEQALEVWRSSCPRHTIWEDALADGLVDCPSGRLTLTDAGRARLAR